VPLPEPLLEPEPVLEPDPVFEFTPVPVPVGVLVSVLLVLVPICESLPEVLELTPFVVPVAEVAPGP
jgi:hypothetical protein